jgi:hypothetical protein
MTNLSDEKLAELKRLSDACPPSEWKALIEGRDHVAGDSFIMVGEGDQRGEDLYLSRYGKRIPDEEWDLVAAARTFLPLLIDEVRELRQQLQSNMKIDDHPVAQISDLASRVKNSEIQIAGRLASARRLGDFSDLDALVALVDLAGDEQMPGELLREVGRSAARVALSLGNVMEVSHNMLRSFAGDAYLGFDTEVAVTEWMRHEHSDE